MLQNVPQVPIAVHAVWHCGGVVTTVNPMNKERELRHQLTDSGARIVVCLESLYAVVAAAREGTAVEHVVTVSELDMLDAVPAALAGHERIECPGAIAVRGPGGAGAGSRLAEVAPRLAGAPHLHLGHHRRAQGGDQHPPRRRPQRRGDDALGSLGAGDVTVAMAPLFHITGLVCHLATARASMTPLLLFYRFEPGEILRLIERWRGSYVDRPADRLHRDARAPELRRSATSPR